MNPLLQFLACDDDIAEQEQPPPELHETRGTDTVSNTHGGVKIDQKNSASEQSACKRLVSVGLCPEQLLGDQLGPFKDLCPGMAEMVSIFFSKKLNSSSRLDSIQEAETVGSPGNHYGMNGDITWKISTQQLDETSVERGAANVKKVVVQINVPKEKQREFLDSLSKSTACGHVLEGNPCSDNVGVSGVNNNNEKGVEDTIKEKVRTGSLIDPNIAERYFATGTIGKRNKPYRPRVRKCKKSPVQQCATMLAASSRNVRARRKEFVEKLQADNALFLLQNQELKQSNVELVNRVEQLESQVSRLQHFLHFPQTHNPQFFASIPASALSHLKFSSFTADEMGREQQGKDSVR